MARPKVPIDQHQVEQLAAIFCTVGEIAAVLGCSKDTIERRFAALIKTGRCKGKMSIRRAQYNVAIKKENVQMLIWLGKQYLEQRDMGPTYKDGDEDRPLKDIPDDELDKL